MALCVALHRSCAAISSYSHRSNLTASRMLASSCDIFTPQALDPLEFVRDPCSENAPDRRTTSTSDAKRRPPPAIIWMRPSACSCSRPIRSAPNNTSAAPPEVRRPVAPVSITCSRATLRSGDSSNARWKVVSNGRAYSTRSRVRFTSTRPSASNTPSATPLAPAAFASSICRCIRSNSCEVKTKSPARGRMRTHIGIETALTLAVINSAVGVVPPSESLEQSSNLSAPPDWAAHAASTLSAHSSKNKEVIGSIDRDPFTYVLVPGPVEKRLRPRRSTQSGQYIFTCGNETGLHLHF